MRLFLENKIWIRKTNVLMIRINVLISRKLYGLSINIVERLFLKIKSAEDTRSAIQGRGLFLSFSIFSKEIPKNLY